MAVFMANSVTVTVNSVDLTDHITGEREVSGDCSIGVAVVHEVLQVLFRVTAPLTAR